MLNLPFSHTGSKLASQTDLQNNPVYKQFVHMHVQNSVKL